MTVEQLGDLVLRCAHAKKEGTSWVIPPDTEATLFVGLPGETLTIPRITRLELKDGSVVAVTARSETFALLCEDIRAVKVEHSEHGRKERSAGFGR
jgi:hypothetical protein